MSTTTVSLRPPVAVQWLKGGRTITLGKVYRQPDGSLALGTPYAGRRFVTPSLPPAVYRYLLNAGVRDWIIRFDWRGTAYRLPLAEVERLATVTPDGELAVPFHYFVRCDYLDWPYAERAVLIEP
jgi:hypothetical protein